MSRGVQAMRELEDYARFRAGLVECSPESFTAEELREMLDDMIRSKVALEDGMRERFATLSEEERTLLLDSLGTSGHKDRDWRCRTLMDGPVHRSRPTC